eukprot:CAMPEP_0169314938 /NCGR_PEP_ID=MMETSP1017-20121227/5375_1 /TAXON_ID=342587 /ORGANISM="Karlodinium micrum, Strain CCMP2283" /LENGTH=389 /DNA_ID=CAMNT_0009408891 /DNA_START=40 /DNA_END=1205 /DNA_ORIENTATION=+
MALQEGTRVVIKGLQSAAGATLNGSHGTILDYDQEKERWEVLADQDPTQSKLLKACNLEVLPLVASAASQEANLQAEQMQNDLPRRRSSSSSKVVHVRASSWPRSSRSVQEPVVLQANLEIERLRHTLHEWQTANQQWQAAYVQLQQQYVLLESENRHLREVVEVAESGPNMNARFIARLARQNWKLGHEVGLRTHDAGSDDGLDSPSETQPKQDSTHVAEEDSDEAEHDSGRLRRPEGMKRLNLRKKEVDDVVMTQIDGEVAESSSAASSSSKVKDEEDDRPRDACRQGDAKAMELKDRQWIGCTYTKCFDEKDRMVDKTLDKEGRPLSGSEDTQSRLEERGRSQASDPSRAQRARGEAVSSGNASSTVLSTVASVLGIAFFAAFTLG